MIPTEPDPDTPASERYVFGRLRDRLPDAWTVLHARRICLPAQEGRPGHEGELDFVLIDPDRGLLALEVNRGGVETAREVAPTMILVMSVSKMSVLLLT